jgi:hypothetical protein
VTWPSSTDESEIVANEVQIYIDAKSEKAYLRSAKKTISLTNQEKCRDLNEVIDIDNIEDLFDETRF